MLKKIMLSVVAVVLLAGVVSLLAQERNEQTQRPRRGTGRMEQGMRPGFGVWFNELAKAHEQKDNKKVGQLIVQMKQNMQRMSRGMTRPGQGMWPEGMGRGGRSMQPGQGRPFQGRAGTLFFDNQLMSKTEAEKKILSVLDDMDKNQRRGMMNVPVEDGRLLRLLTEMVGAKHVVEIGTSNGYSGIWFCLALRKTGGKLTTHELDATRASLARKNFKRAGVDKLVTLVEGDAHKTVTKLKGPIDILFLDADKEGYIDYLNKLLPLVRPGGLIVAHNMNLRQADKNYVKAITTNPNLETLFLHMDRAGVGVTMKKR